VGVAADPGGRMQTIEIPSSPASPPEHAAGRGITLRTALLGCGIAASLLYAAMLVFVPMAWPGYSSASRTISELSAIDAPTRPLWTAVGIAWAVLYAAFGVGVWRSARGSRGLRVAGVVIVVAAVVGLFWPPMHQREVLAAGGKSLTDTLHIAWTMMNGVLTLAAMAFAAAALGRRFRLYTIGTIVVLLAAGAWTGTYASRIEANLPTPGAGVWERVNVGAWLLWVAVLAVVLLRRRPNGRNRRRRLVP
jgi:hypothetical membrane protein